MDKRLNILKMRKEEAKNQKMEQEIAKSAIDSHSGIIIRKGTRTITEDEIKVAAGSRHFIDVMSMDMFESRSEQAKLQQSQGFFTIGVVTESSPPIAGKSGKQFSIMKITDLIKYDMNKVRLQLTEHLEDKIKKSVCDKDEIKTALKSFTTNGYKQIKIMCFEESATELTHLRPGVIIQLINPRLMKVDPNHGISFSITSKN